MVATYFDVEREVEELIVTQADDELLDAANARLVDTGVEEAQQHFWKCAEQLFGLIEGYELSVYDVRPGQLLVSKGMLYVPTGPNKLESDRIEATLHDGVVGVERTVVRTPRTPEELAEIEQGNIIPHASMLNPAELFIDREVSKPVITDREISIISRSVDRLSDVIKVLGVIK